MMQRPPIAANVQDALAGLGEAQRVQRYWEEHYQQLLGEYAEQFVAVDIDNAEVIASNADLAMLAYTLRDRGIDMTTDVAIHFITPRSSSFLL